MQNITPTAPISSSVPCAFDEIQCEELGHLETAARAEEARAEYEAQIEFASLQLRARALLPKAWEAYSLECEKTRVLDDILERNYEQLGLSGRSVLYVEMKAFYDLRKFFFDAWRDLQALAYAEERAVISDAEVAAGLAAVASIEQRQADELLNLQLAHRMRRLEREAAEKELAQAQAEGGDDPFKDE